jgi:hypothetical protein
MNEKINKTMSKQYLTQGAHAVAAMGGILRLPVYEKKKDSNARLTTKVAGNEVSRDVV